MIVVSSPSSDKEFFGQKIKVEFATYIDSGAYRGGRGETH